MKSITLTILSFFLLVSCISEKKTEINKVPVPEVNQDTIIKVVENKNLPDSAKVSEKTDALKTLKSIEENTKIIEKETPVIKEPKIKNEAKTTISSTETTINEKPKALSLEKVVEENSEDVEKIEEPIILKPNHEIWNTLTKKYVSSNGKVNYAGFKKDITNVNKYLLHLEEVSPDKIWSRNEKLAYWFNLYNAATVYLIANNYPTQSIRDLEGGKPWDKKFIKSGTKTLSLNEIENSIVRPNYNEPRLHAAFNCAAVSCPNLLNEAFMPSKLNSQLNMLSKQWVNDVSKNVIAKNEIKISKIFEWYAADFKEGVIPFINKYSNQKVNPNAKISYLEYNWKLNN